jgi:histone deacetylase 11
VVIKITLRLLMSLNLKLSIMGNKTSKPKQQVCSSLGTSPQACTAPLFQQNCVNAKLATVGKNLPPEYDYSSSRNKLPLVYSPKYNISFWGIENLHPFDSKKYAHIIKMLEDANVLEESQLTAAPEATLELLKDVHTTSYLEELSNSSIKVAMVTQLAPLALLPAFLLRKKVLLPMRLMAGGSVLAGALALERGWALNLGGGMHHASYHDGGGWCCYDDTTLLLRTLKRASKGEFTRAMVVDVDVHQGNGHERSKLHFTKQAATDNDMPDVFTVDVYNKQIYPLDNEAKAAIDVDVPLRLGTSDEEYLKKLSSALEEAFRRCQPPPQLLVYNAGTDILVGDPLGGLNVSEQGVIRRDEMVFEAALKHKVPVVMMTSGGYSKNSAACIAHSIENLVQKFGFGFFSAGA